MDQISVKYIFNIFSGSTPESGQAFFWDGDHNWFTPDDLGKIGNKIYVDESNRKITDEGVENANLRFGGANSIIITKRAPIGNLAITKLPSSCNQGCFILEKKSSEVNVKYYYYYFLIQKDKLNNLGRGSTFLELNADEMKSYKAPLPSLSKQNKIVDYLDHEVAKIDALIEKKKQLIAILEEKKKAVINQAVTKGLDPNVSMKDSKSDWFKEIPNHWELMQIKHTCDSIETGGTPKGYDVPLDEIIDEVDIIEWYTPVDISSDYTILGEAKRKLNLNVVNSPDIKIYPSNSVLFVGIGTIGKIGIPISKFYCNQQINVMIVKKDFSNKFIGYLLMSYKEAITSIANSATLPILNQQKLGALTFYFPDFNEQNSIVTHLEKYEQKISKLIILIKDSLSILKEKRTAIISAAVNGELNASLS